MNSKNFSTTQRMFSELSLRPKSGARCSPKYPGSNNDSELVDKFNAFEESPEIHDMIRFQNAIMLKYYQTQDAHFKNIADAMKPQIDEKIRDFNGRTTPAATATTMFRK